MTLSPTMLQGVADEIKREAQRWRAQLAFADELVRIGKIENAANEAQERLDALRSEIAATTAATLDDAKREADEIVAQGRIEAQQLVESAKSAALELVAQGRIETQQQASAAVELENRLATARDALAGVEADITEKRESLEAINAAIADGHRDHERIKSAIAEMKAKLF